MELYNLVLDGIKVSKIGYRVKTDKGNVYDIHTKREISDVKVSGNIHGELSAGMDIFRSSEGLIPVELREEKGRDRNLTVETLFSLIGSSLPGFNCDVKYGERLSSSIKIYNDLNRRYYVKKLVRSILKDDFHLYELFGVRRTGKTVSMYHIMDGLLKGGVDLRDMCYVSLKGNNLVNSDELADIVDVMANKEGIKYIFIDEITYISDNIDFLKSYGDSVDGSTIIMSGTNSSVFLTPNIDSLYDRSAIQRTTRIPFKEFSYLYPNATILDYIRAGGVLRKKYNYNKEYEEDYNYNLKESKDSDVDAYITSSIYKNILNGLERSDAFSWMTPPLYKLYISGNKEFIRTVLIKMAQRNSMDIVYTVLEKEFVSSDIGSMLDLYAKDSTKLDENGIQNKELVKLRKHSKDMKKVLGEMLSDELSIMEKPKGADINMESILSSMKDYLRKINCLYSNSYLLETGGSKVPEIITVEYFSPILVRYGLACKLVGMLKDRSKEFCDRLLEEVKKKGIIDLDATLLYNSVDDMINDALNGVEGELCEEIIRTDLNSVRPESVGKFRSDISGMEIDILYKNDIVEVKNADHVYVDQARWLLDLYFLEDERYKNKRRVLLTNMSEEKVVYWSRRDALKSLKESKEKRGIKVSKSILDELESDDKRLDIKQEVYCLNISKYLLNAYDEEVKDRLAHEKK